MPNPKKYTTILRAAEVRTRTGLSQSQLYNLQARGLFPHSIKLSPYGSAVGWIESEIEDWIQSRVTDRNRKA